MKKDFSLIPFETEKSAHTFGMKRYILIFLCLILFAAVGTLLLTSCAPAPDREKYIRIHIRANSDSEEDQTIRLAVRDSLVHYLAPLALTAKTKEEMWELMKNRKSEIEKIADDTLLGCGYSYTARVKLGKEAFPTRSYGDLTLEKGTYDAVVVELGTGKGKNWWCVAFPPLCFVAAKETGTEEIRYRSWIAELFHK